MQIVVIILTFNSEQAIAQVIQSCQNLASRVVVVDSYSRDRTLEIVESLGCELVQHEFDNYSQQRNWAQAYANLAPDDWVLHLDSDEVVSAELATSIERVKNAAAEEITDIDGYLVRRLSYFLGKPIRFGHINPSWHLRLYRANKGFCEHRLYDQHFVVAGKTQKLTGLLLDLQLTTIETWTAAHNRWSTAEAKEIWLQLLRNNQTRNNQTDNSTEIGALNSNLGNQNKLGDRTLPANLFGDLRMKKRWLKNNVWYRTPPLLRAFLFFFYSYFLRLGFLDGRTGLIYHVLQAFWFRFLVDAKIIEMQIKQSQEINSNNHQLG